jgi:diguanylate cyclase (GGDEF)-like protein
MLHTPPTSSIEGSAFLSEQVLSEIEGHRSEAIRAIFFLYLVALSAMIVYAIVDARMNDAAFLGGAVLLSLLFRPLLFRFSDRKTVHLGFATAIAVILLWVTATGGIGNTGYLWIMLFPSFSMFLLGIRRGFAMSIALMMLVGVVFVLIGRGFFTAQYSPEVMLRAGALYLLLTALTLVYERTRSKTDRSIRRLSEKLSYRASTDHLTGLLNRASFEQIVRSIDAPFSVIMMDVDKFKAINDEHGHLRGDEVLLHLANHLRHELRRNDIVARWGGEEFVIVLPGSDSLGAPCVAEQLRLRLESADFAIPVTASFGVAHTDEADSVEQCIALADRRLYAAKDGGRNRVVGPTSLSGCFERE